MLHNSRTEEVLTRYPVDKPVRVLLAFVLLASLLVYGVKYLGFSADHRVFFESDNEQLNAYERLQKKYSKNDSLLFALRPKQEGAQIYEHLDAVKWLTDQAWQLPHSIRVDSISNFQHTRSNDDNVIVESLYKLDALPVDRLSRIKELARVERIASNEPALAGRLIALDGVTAGVLITLHFPDDDAMAGVEAVQAARALIDRFNERYPELDTAMSGIAAVSNAYAEASQHDMSVLIPIILLLLMIAVAVFLRSLMATLLCALVFVVSALAAMGFAGWVGIALTPPVANVPIIVLCIAIADSVHVLSSVLRQLADNVPRKQAIIASICDNARPIHYTSLTTAIGFLALNTSASPPYQDMGNMVAVGILVAWAASLFMLPALIALLPLKSKSGPLCKHYFFRMLAVYVSNRQPQIFCLSIIIIVSLSAFLVNLNIDDKIIENFDTDMQIRKDSEFVLENLTGIYQMEFSIDSGEDSGLANPDFLRQLESFTVWLRSQPEVVAVSSFSDDIKRMNLALNGGDPSYYQLPESQTLAAQYILLYEYSLPYGLTLQDTITIDKSATRVVAYLGGISTQQIIDIKDRAESWLKERALLAPGLNQGTGVSVMFSYLSHHNITGMIKGTLLGLVIISLTMLFLLQDIRLGLVSLIPNLLPVLVLFGLWGAFVGRVGTPASMVTIIALGLIVDATAHILVRYKRQLDAGAGEAAIYKAFESAGPPIAITTFVLILGFSIMSQSAFNLNAELGLMCAILLSIALLMDFILLPAVLFFINRRSEAVSLACPQLPVKAE